MAYQPKSYRKFVATAATATLVAGVLAPAVSAASFTDVPERYQDAVDFVVSKGIQGFSDTQFGTGENIKRVDAAVMVAKVVGLDTENAPAAGFTDVPARAQGAVNALKAAGITSGKSTTSFGAQDLITRGELAIWIDRAFNLEGSADHNFTDVADRYAEAVEALVANEITQGVSATQFGVTQNAKRGDFAIFLHRASAEVTPVNPEVVGVSSINAAQVEIKFNKAVKASSVVDSDGTLKASVFTFTKVSGTGTVTVDDYSLATLSEDGKTLTVTASAGSFKSLNFVVTAPADTIEFEDGSFTGSYTSNVIATGDTVAPTVTGVTKLNATTVRVNFSEPLSGAGNWSFKFADGTTATVNPSTANIAKGYVDLTIDAGIDAGKEITATIIGAADYAGNLISPNPVTVSFSKGALDGTKPSVSTITPIGLNKVEIKFSEEVQGFGASDITVDGTPRTANDSTAALTGTEAIVTQDSSDKTKYVVEFVPFNSAGLHTIGLSANSVTDLSGEANNAFSRVIDFKADTVDPKLANSEVKVVDGTEYLYLTFDESVDAGNLTSLAATQVKDYVTVEGTINLSGLTAVTNTDEKQYRVALSGVQFDPDNGPAATIADGAEYTVSLTGAFEDKSNNDLGSTSVKFSRGADKDTGKPTIVKTVDNGESTPKIASNGIHVTANNKFQVTFNKAVDGASATNKANYVVNGATVKSATLLPNNIVEVTFEDDSITLGGLRNVTISGVKSSAGVVMDAYSTSEYFVENVRPVVTSASLVAQDQIKVVFSEAVDASKVTAADLDVFVGTTKEAETGKFNVTRVGSTGSTDKEFIITLDDALTATEYAQTLTVEIVHDTTNANSVIADENGNLVKTGVFTVSK